MKYKHKPDEVEVLFVSKSTTNEIKDFVGSERITITRPFKNHVWLVEMFVNVSNNCYRLSDDTVIIKHSDDTLSFMREKEFQMSYEKL